MKVALTPGEQVGAFVALVLAALAAPLLWLRERDEWEFVLHWDDRENFVRNAVLRAPVSLAALHDMWTMTLINVYEPLAWMVKFAVAKVAGPDDAWAVRVATVALHVASCAMLARVSTRLLELLDALQRETSSTSSRAKHYWLASVVSATVFAVHPVHVQVVAWPSGQSYALAALFAHLAIDTYIGPIHETLVKAAAGPSHDTIRRILSGEDRAFNKAARLATGLYICALLSKSAALLLPASFVLIDMLLLASLRPRPSFDYHAIGRYAARKLPVLSVLATFVIVTITSNHDGALENADVVFLTPYERVIKALGTPAALAQLVLWPARLRPHYQLREGQFASLSSADSLLPVAALVVATWLALERFHRPQHVLALAYVAAMILPVSGLVQHGMVAGAADRYAYLSSTVVVPYGAALIARWSTEFEHQRAVEADREPPESTPVVTRQQAAPLTWKQKTQHFGFLPRHKWALLGLITAMLLSIALPLMDRWRSERALYTYALEMDPADWRAIDDMTEFLTIAGDCERDPTACTILFKKSLALIPNSTLKGKLNRLRVQITLGDFAGACKEYLAMLESEESSSSCHVLNNAAFCLIDRGRPEEAHALFERALATARTAKQRAEITVNLVNIVSWFERKRAADPDEDVQFSGKIMF